MKQQNRKNNFILNSIPQTGFLRLKQIIGNPKANPPVPPIIPISRSAWWGGIGEGRYPRPIRLSARAVAWKVEDIIELINKLGGDDNAAA